MADSMEENDLTAPLRIVLAPKPQQPEQQPTAVVSESQFNTAVSTYLPQQNTQIPSNITLAQHQQQLGPSLANMTLEQRQQEHIQKLQAVLDHINATSNTESTNDIQTLTLQQASKLPESADIQQVMVEDDAEGVLSQPEGGIQFLTAVAVEGSDIQALIPAQFRGDGNAAAYLSPANLGGVPAKIKTESTKKIKQERALTNAMMLEQKSRYKCEKCGKCFIKPVELIYHRHSHYLMRRVPKICRDVRVVQSRALRDNSLLYKCTLNDQTGKKTVVYRCLKCHKKFRYLSHLHRHLLQKHIRVVKCDQCSKSIPVTWLKLHMSIAHRTSSAMTYNAPPPNRYSCRLCNMPFLHRATLANHRHHSLPGGASLGGGAVSITAIIPASKSSVNSSGDSSMLQCEECAFAIDCMEEMEIHMEEEHPGVRYPCNKCSFSVLVRKQLYK